MDSSSTTSRREAFLAISLIVLTTFLTYGVLLSKLGFYRDDWYLLWTAEALGRDGILNLFKGDRPFVGWLYVFDFSVIGVSPFGWHLYALGIKLASAFAFFWLVRSLWPNRKLETTFITLLYVVYPGFYQQPNALTFKQLLLAYAAALLSLALTVNAVKSSRAGRSVFFTVLAVLSSAFYILIYEALVGMEVVRLLLLWYLFYQQSREWKESVRLALARAIPYVSFAALFVFWRIFIFHSTRKATSVEGLIGSYTSLHGLIRLVAETGKDLLETSILAWGVPFYQFSSIAIYKDLGLALGLGILVVLAGAGYYLLMKKQTDVLVGQATESALDWLVLGAIIIIVTTLPVVVAGRNVVFQIQWDRYTYQSALGVALLIGGFVFYALRGNLRWIFLSLLLISGVATQVFSAMYYRDFWSVEREAWWQLYWRAPQIENGTTVIASLPGNYQLAEEYEAWGALNLLYHRGEKLQISAQVPFQDILLQLKRGLQEERLVRDTVVVKRNYDQSLIISIPSSNACLHVYDHALGISPAENPLVALIAPYSRTDWIQIDAVPPVPPEDILGAEPVHGWCFYFQKINLALQSADWSLAGHYVDEALVNDLRPYDSVEWLPVLFAYANLDRTKDLRRASKFINDKFTRWYLCDQLKSVTEWPQGYKFEPVIENLCTVQ